MRTTVTVPDQEDNDEYPGCGAATQEDGGLLIITEDSAVEEEYAPAQWSEVLIVNE